MKDSKKDLKKQRKVMINDENKIFFQPGNVVTLKQDIPNKPKMIVQRVERSLIKNTEGKEYLRGIKCRWYSTDMKLQEAVYSTKDLILLEE